MLDNILDSSIMPRIRYEPGHVSTTAACRWAGVSQTTYLGWARDGTVPGRGTTGCDLADCLEITVLTVLASYLTPDDARAAMKQVSSTIRNLTQVPTLLDAVWQDQLQKVTLIETTADLPAVVRHGRLVRVIPLAEALADTKASYDRAVRDQRDRGTIRRSRAQAREGTR